MPAQRDGKGLLLTEFFGPETFDQGAAFVGQPWSDVMHPNFAGGADPTGARSSLPAFQAALNSVIGAGGVSGTLNIPAIVNGVVANYVLDGPLLLPSSGAGGLVIQGTGIWSPHITMTGGASFLSVPAGYHYDLTVKGLRIDQATDALKFTTAGQVVRLVLENIQFFSCTNAIRSDSPGGIVGFTFRNLNFNGCGGDNIKCNPLYQFGPGTLDNCWFQAGGVGGFSSYVNASHVGNTGGDNWTFLQPIFEGGVAGPALKLGAVAQWKMIGAIFADWNDTGSIYPLIQTAGLNGQPQRMSFYGCDLESATGPIIKLGSGGSMVRAAFYNCLLVAKPGASPFDVSVGNAEQWEFHGCQVTPAQSSWGPGAVRWYDSQEAGLNTGLRAINSADSKAVGTQTLAANGAVTIDSSLCSIQAVTLQANATSSSISASRGGPWLGQELTIEWIQDATGSRSYAWPANCKFAGAAAPTASTGANRRDSVSFRYDGSNWIETARAVNVG